jgi:hypothetical protein
MAIVDHALCMWRVRTEVSAAHSYNLLHCWWLLWLLSYRVECLAGAWEHCVLSFATTPAFSRCFATVANFMTVTNPLQLLVLHVCVESLGGAWEHCILSLATMPAFLRLCWWSSKLTRLQQTCTVAAITSRIMQLAMSRSRSTGARGCQLWHCWAGSHFCHVLWIAWVVHESVAYSHLLPLSMPAFLRLWWCSKVTRPKWTWTAMSRSRSTGARGCQLWHCWAGGHFCHVLWIVWVVHESIAYSH